MAKKDKNSFFKKLIKYLLLIFLIANFCWDGKPLYKYIYSGNEPKKIKNGVENLKKETDRQIDKIKDRSDKYIKKARGSVKDVKSDIKEKYDGKIPTGTILKKEQEEMEKLIKEKTDGK
ncbi:MAG: hypothetical protein R6W70_11225 [bacterium]